MRAPVQMKRPRSNNGTRSRTPGAAPTPDGTAAAPPAQAQPPAGRPKRVRNRLVAGVALVGITVLAAGAPAVLAASAELTDSQRLVTLAELDRQAVTLAHSLADERDEVVAYIAAGRDNQTGDAKHKRQITSARSTRVDRQIDEIRPAATTELRRDLAGVPSVRRAALTGKGSALEAHRAYSEVIGKLQALADELADKTPARAADTALTEATRAPAALGRAVEQASATRGLLLAALSVTQPEPTGDVHYDSETDSYVPDVPEGAAEAERARDTLTAAAQQARVRELAALGDFDQAAGSAARDSLAATVSGPDVKSAERSLASLTDQPKLTEAERDTDPAGLEAALSSRVEQMRGVESALATQRVERLAALRDDDVTALELRIAFLGGCLIVAIGISTYVARTLTRPLAVLRIGAARLAAAPVTRSGEDAEPVRFTGRNDEFAQVVRSLNTLHGKLTGLAAHNESLTDRLSDGQDDLAAAKEALGAELAAQRAELQGRAALLTAELERLRGTVHHTFVNLSLRSLGLVERQLGVIEKLEEREQDPDRLATLFKLDHMATVMRRHSENLLVLAGHEHVHGHAGPVPLVDVLRAAVSEIERYERVTIQSLPPHAQIAGFAADDLSHLIAELLENATSFSPPDAEVQLSGWLLETGEVMLSVQDAGIGMTPGRLAELNARLAEADPSAFEGEGLGMRVIALLAARHGVRVELREQQPGGTAAVVVLPPPLLPTAPPATVTEPVRVSGATPALQLPGSAAEANSNTLPSRNRDPLVEAAERAFLEAEVNAARGEAEEPAEEAAEREPEPERAYEPEPEQAFVPEPAYEPEPEPAYEPEPAHEPEQTYEPAPAASPSPEAAPPGLGESVSETTLQVRLPDPPPEPDTHERAADAESAVAPEPAPEPEADPSVPGPRAAQWERVTDKGLPKRTPQVVRQAGAAATPRKGGVDAEALRRRLGGFHQGAKAGRRDVEAELDTARTEDVRTARTEEMSGDTVEEARS
ncbi:MULTISPECIES: nitrate- and nitrite sensing domain-containing protein [unclassified Streptomyces]|uniref:sensor histidine kinase n=1 Tax=unclassified Streptomyces TaxID=2593676 RepID=UPI0018FEE20D|nr:MULTISPECIES: nitrate- and nitrite sensing domain-containing protein [unclassified Streptomyces]